MMRKNVFCITKVENPRLNLIEQGPCLTDTSGSRVCWGPHTRCPAGALQGPPPPAVRANSFSLRFAQKPGLTGSVPNTPHMTVSLQPKLTEDKTLPLGGGGHSGASLSDFSLQKAIFCHTGTALV